MLDTVQRVHTLFSRPFYPIGVMSALGSETGLPVVMHDATGLSVVSHECMARRVCRLHDATVLPVVSHECMMQQVCQLLVMSA